MPGSGQEGIPATSGGDCMLIAAKFKVRDWILGGRGYLCRAQVKREYLQLVGATCMLIEKETIKQEVKQR